MRFGDLTYEEIAHRASLGALMVLPTGCTEQQRPHLTVDFGTWLAQAVCDAAAARLDELGDAGCGRPGGATVTWWLRGSPA